MELNQTSPPPTSPVLETDGEDPCRIEVTDVVVDTVTLLICLCGLAGNGAVLWLLGFRIRRNPITVYILNLAVADFTFLLFMVTSSLLYVMKNVSCSTVVSLTYLRSLLLLSLFSYNMGLYLLTAISIERCVSVLCSSIRRPQHLSAVVYDAEHCRVSLISMYVRNFLIFAPPMVISNVILFIKVLCGSKRRQPKRLYIVIFLTVLFFLSFGVPLSIWNFLQQFSYIFVSSQVFFLLACINSSINPFIYFLVGSCRRHCSLVSLQVAFQRVFEETGVTMIAS
ncbi:PREDICTED: mas-related G-protein coupled receptor member H-like [Eurypyga helias]|uniref:mas-related G-protein coupled receptor member H-like n=1 Tax=Eurypyga helias TaxID=54383 RepID=UPI0005289E45|nr:PREDICTED: mas-related G-protein coupled receptor member H-like [Eurypyga helias]